MSHGSNLIKLIKQIAIANSSAQAGELVKAAGAFRRYLHEIMPVCAQFAKEHDFEISSDDTLDGRDESGLTPLMWAAKLGLTYVMEALLSKDLLVGRAKLDSVDHAGMTAAHHAALSGNERAMRVLCSTEEGRQTLTKGDNMTGANPLFLAAAAGKTNVVTYLVQEQKMSVSERLCIPAKDEIFPEKPYLSYGESAKLPIVHWMLYRQLLQKKYPQLDEVTEDELFSCLGAVHQLGALLDIKAHFNSNYYPFTDVSALRLAIASGLPKIVEFLGKRISDERAFCYAFGMSNRCFSIKQFTSDESLKLFEALLNETTLLSCDSDILDKQLTDIIENTDHARIILRSTRLHELNLTGFFAHRIFLKAAKLDIPKRSMQICYEEKRVTQAMVDEVFISRGTSHRFMKVDMLAYLIQNTPRPSELAQRAVIKYLIDEPDNGLRLYDDSHNFDFKCVKKLMELGLDPLVTGSKNFNVIERAIIQCKKIRLFPSAVRGVYTHLKELLELEAIRKNPEAMKYCEVRYAKALRENDTQLVECFKQSGVSPSVQQSDSVLKLGVG